MARPVFEIARDFQRKIEEDINSGFRFKNTVRNDFLADLTLNETVRRSQLGARQAEFGIADLNQNFGTRLETSRFDARNSLNESRDQFETFGSRKELRDRQRQLQLADTETKITKITNDAKYEELKMSIPDFDAKDKFMKYEELFSKIEENPDKFGDRIKKRAIEDIRKSMPSEFKILELFDAFMVEPSGKPGSAQQARKQKLFQQFALAAGRVDEDLLRFAIEKEIIKDEEVHPLFLDALLDQITNPDGQPAPDDPQLAADPDVPQGFDPIVGNQSQTDSFSGADFPDDSDVGFDAFSNPDVNELLPADETLAAEIDELLNPQGKLFVKFPTDMVQEGLELEEVLPPTFRGVMSVSQYTPANVESLSKKLLELKALEAYSDNPRIQEAIDARLIVAVTYIKNNIELIEAFKGEN